MIVWFYKENKNICALIYVIFSGRRMPRTVLGARYSVVVACQMQLRDVKPTYIHRQFTF